MRPTFEKMYPRFRIDSREDDYRHVDFWLASEWMIVFLELATGFTHLELLLIYAIECRTSAADRADAAALAFEHLLEHLLDEV